MAYQDRIDRVITYIGRNLDEELTLEELCEVACFSKYHFHRLFTAYTGVSLHAYIRWLRLKRAAFQLTMQKEKSILNVALDAGFESHEAFTRHFKSISGLSPRDFRSKPQWSQIETPQHPLRLYGEMVMQYKIQEQPARRLATVEHRGDPSKIIYTLDKLLTWSKKQDVDVGPKAGEAFGFGYHDPRDVKPEDFCFDFALSVPEALSLSGDVVEKKLPAERYAIALHKGSRDTLGDTVIALYKKLFPDSGEELADHPCVFCYKTFDHDVAETEQLTEVWMLLK